MKLENSVELAVSTHTSSPIVSRQLDDEEIRQKKSSFESKPNVITASDLLDAAIVAGLNEVAVKAAALILQVNSTAVDSLKAKAKRVLARNSGDFSASTIGLEKSNLRAATRANQFDAIAWLDLAYHQTVAGHFENAERSVLISLRLAPENRHVVRAASRFFLHIGDRVRAHNTILKCKSTRYDPWLMATEISLAELADRSPSFIRQATRTVDQQQLSPAHVSELSGAIATFELNGRRKVSRRFFENSLVDPTGNSLAQAAWAQTQMSQILIPQNFNFIAEYEAPAHVFYSQGLWETAFTHGRSWIEDEPYAARPYEFTTATAGLLGFYDSAIIIADQGLRLARSKGNLLASKAFALARLGKVVRAEQCLVEMGDTSNDQKLNSFKLANLGLIAYRLGEHDKGYELYNKAIAGFRAIDETPNQLSAMAYHAYEAYLAKYSAAERLEKEAKDAVAKVSNAVTAKYVISQLDGLKLNLIHRNRLQIEEKGALPI